MATIVVEKESRTRFVLVGSGYGAFKATRPGMFLGNWAPTETDGEFPLVLVCNSAGDLFWGQSSEFEILSVDGETPAEILVRPAPG